MKRAVADARGRAEAAASGAGVTIDRVLRIEEQRGFPAGTAADDDAARGRDGSELRPQTPITAGELEVRARRDDDDGNPIGRRDAISP